MIAHKDEIYSRRKKTWFQTEKEKKMVVNAAKVISCFNDVCFVNMISSCTNFV